MTSDIAQLKDFAWRAGEIIASLLSLQSDLLRALGDASGAQAALVGLFSQPAPARLRQKVEPWQNLAPRLQLGFDPGVEVALTIEPKLDHALSPESCLNTVTIGYGGGSRYVCLGAWGSWADFAEAQRYQLGIYGVPDRLVPCYAVLRLPEKGGGDRDVQFSSFDLRPEERACNPSGSWRLPEDIEIDRERLPLLLLFFDPQRDFEIRLDYLSVYFA